MGKATQERNKPEQAPPRQQAAQFKADFVMHVETARTTKAYRRIAVIRQLRDTEQLTDDRFVRLAYYADQAALAEKSPVKSCCDDTPRGNHGPGAAIISAMIETGRIERDLGVLRDIAHAIAVEDKTLAQWCIDRYGGRERYGRDGKFVAIVPINEKRHMKLALIELKMAADRITLGP